MKKFLLFVLLCLPSTLNIARAECSLWECECTNGNVSEVGSRAACARECGGAGKVKSVSAPDCRHAPAELAPLSFLEPAISETDCAIRVNHCAEGCERRYGDNGAAVDRCVQNTCTEAKLCRGNAPLEASFEDAEIGSDN